MSICGRNGSSLFFFNDTATTEIYTLSLHDALPISAPCAPGSFEYPWYCPSQTKIQAATAVPRITALALWKHFVTINPVLRGDLNHRYKMIRIRDFTEKF